MCVRENLTRDGGMPTLSSRATVKVVVVLSRRCRTCPTVCHRAPRARAPAPLRLHSPVLHRATRHAVPRVTCLPWTTPGLGERRGAERDGLTGPRRVLSRVLPARPARSSRDLLDASRSRARSRARSRSPRCLLKTGTWLPHATRARNVGCLAQVSPGSPSSLSLSPYATRETAGAGAAAAGVAA